MKHAAPNPSGVAAVHWNAAREGRLSVPYCGACARFHWPPRAACPNCGGEPSWREAAGTGRVSTFSIVRRALNAELAGDAPYVIAFVELDEGIRIFSNIVDAEPETLRCGMRVRCRFEAALDPAVRVPVFAPEKE